MGRKVGDTNAKAQAHIDECIVFITRDSISHNDWCRYAVDNYGMTKRRAEMIWSKAWEVLRERYQKDAQENLTQALLRLDDLYRKATEEGGDWNTRANILREKNKLLGLHTEKIETKSEINLKFDFDE